VRFVVTRGDPYEGETRFRAIGHNSEGRPLFVVFATREKDGEHYCSADQRPLQSQEQAAMKKSFPQFDSDEQPEAFLDTADLDEYDLTAGALPRDEWFARYERFAKDASIHLRLPDGLLEAVQAQAAKQRIPTQRLIREYIERGLRAPKRGEPARRVRVKP
jgi:predicted DNA binding CopG/RHH family protein